MRWFLIDKFLVLEKGKRAVTIKNVTLGEDHIHDPFPGYPMMPAPLIIESMAQTGGILAGVTYDFKQQVVLAKVENATFYDLALPGDQLRIEANMVEIREEGCRTEGTVTVGDRKIADIRLMFAHLNTEEEGEDGFVFTDEFLKSFLHITTANTAVGEITNVRRIVVSEMGIISPLGIGVDTFWNGLLEGRSGIGPITLFDTTDFDTRIAGEVSDFNPKKLIKQRKALKVMARDIQLAVAAGQIVMEQIGPDALEPTRFGMSLGAGLITADLDELAPSMCAAKPGSEEFSLPVWGSEGLKCLFPLWLLKYLPNMLGCHLAIFHDAQGPNNSITTGPVASSQAIGEAYRVIERDSADCMLVGGAESKITPLNMLRYNMLGETSTRNDEPEKACRPFDSARDGIVIGEGAGIIMIEELEHAKKRGSNIAAEIIGYATCTGGSKAPIGELNAQGIELSITKALDDASLTTDDVSFIVSSASGLPEEDSLEAQAILKVFGERAASIPVTSIRSMIGHLAAGSGALDFAAACLAVRDGKLPGTINFDKGDPDFGLNVITGSPVDVGPVGLVITSGSFSQASSIVVKRFEQ